MHKKILYMYKLFLHVINIACEHTIITQLLVIKLRRKHAILHIKYRLQYNRKLIKNFYGNLFCIKLLGSEGGG